jgi:spore maturation protein CgeB
VYGVFSEGARRASTLVRVMLLHPGATWSTADVSAGLRYGLIHHGVQVVDYRLDARIHRASMWLGSAWRAAKKQDPTFVKPTHGDVFLQAGGDVVNMALDHQVDAVVVVSGMFLIPRILTRLTRAHIPVTVLFTESPYDHQELDMAKLVDGCWTTERSALPAFQAVNRNAGYLPHGWHPERHQPGLRDWDAEVPAHDVVFVGSAFQERIDWLSAIDWTGIDFGLYGQWTALRRHKLRQYVKGDGRPITNSMTTSLYRRAKIGLNLYRTSRGWGKHALHITHAESLNPRAYELAACGSFHLSGDRAEVGEVFGDLVPTFRHPTEASRLMRAWLADPDGRARVAAALPACVAEMSWAERATRVIGDLQRLLGARGRAA